MGRTNDNIRLRIEENYLKSSSANIPGRQVLDGLNLISDPFLQQAPSMRNAQFESYSLEDVAQEILGKGKLLKGTGRHDQIEKLFKQNTQKSHQELVDYNLTDCKLVHEILEKTKTIELSTDRAQLTGMPLDRITSSIAAFDSLFLREEKKHKLVSPTTHYQEKAERIKGGYVFSAGAGIFNNVLVLDFKSLYPSILCTFNISPDSHLGKEEKGSVESPNNEYFKNSQGVLPEMIFKLHEAREKTKKEKNELANYAIKTTMNCFSPDTEILTENGLKNIEKVDIGERVYSINPSNQNIEIHPVVNKFFYPYKGKMIKIKSNVVDYLVTPNHRFLVDFGAGYEWKEAKDLLKGKKDFWLPEHTKINGKIIREIDIEELCKKYNISYRKKGDMLQKGPKHSSIPNKFKIEDWLELIGWYLSEGHVYTSKPRRYPGKISWRGITKTLMISQKTKDYRKDIERLFERMGLKYCTQFNGISTNNHIIAEIIEKECGIGSNSK